MANSSATFARYSRADWKARNPKGSLAPLNKEKVTHFVIHFDGSSALGLRDIKTLMRSFQIFHQNTRGWKDIAYNSAVGQSGERAEARGAYVGGHLRNEQNSVAWGTIAAIGATETPTSNLKIGLLKEYAFACIWAGKTLSINGHTNWPQANKPCPGKFIISWIADGCPSPDGILRMGNSKSDAVKKMQKLLKISDDGYYGIGTYRAVVAFQKANKLLTTGEIDSVTKSLIEGGAPQEPPVVTPPVTPPVTPAPEVKLSIGFANMQLPRFGGSRDFKARADYLRTYIKGSVYLLVECDKEMIEAIVKEFGGNWQSWRSGTVCILWDGNKYDYSHADDISLGTAYHRGVRVRLTLKKTQKFVEFIAGHVRPAVSFGKGASKAVVLAGKQNDIRKIAGLVRDFPTVVAGDWNTGTAFDVLSKYGLFRATPAVDTSDVAGDQKLDMMVVKNVVVESSTLFNPGKLSDHKWWKIVVSFVKGNPNV